MTILTRRTVVAGGAAMAELAGNSRPVINTVRIKKLIKRAVRIFIGGDYIRDVVGAIRWVALSGEFIFRIVYGSPVKNNH